MKEVGFKSSVVISFFASVPRLVLKVSTSACSFSELTYESCDKFQTLTIGLQRYLLKDCLCLRLLTCNTGVLLCFFKKSYQISGRKTKFNTLFETGKAEGKAKPNNCGSLKQLRKKTVLYLGHF